MITNDDVFKCQVNCYKPAFCLEVTNPLARKMPKNTAGILIGGFLKKDKDGKKAKRRSALVIGAHTDECEFCFGGLRLYSSRKDSGLFFSRQSDYQIPESGKNVPVLRKKLMRSGNKPETFFCWQLWFGR